MTCVCPVMARELRILAIGDWGARSPWEGALASPCVWDLHARSFSSLLGKDLLPAAGSAGTEGHGDRWLSFWGNEGGDGGGTVTSAGTSAVAGISCCPHARVRFLELGAQTCLLPTGLMVQTPGGTGWSYSVRGAWGGVLGGARGGRLCLPRFHPVSAVTALCLSICRFKMLLGLQRGGGQ